MTTNIQYNICFYENQFEEIRGSVDFCNSIYYQGKIQYEFYASSDLIPLESLGKFNLILIDLDLSPRGSMDGYALIKEIQKLFPQMSVGIITGATFVKDKLIEYELKNIPFLLKPFDFEELHSFLVKFNITP